MFLCIVFALLILLIITVYLNKRVKHFISKLEFSLNHHVAVFLNIAFVQSSAITVLAMSGIGYLYGFSGMWTSLITATSGYVPLLFLGKRFAKMANEYKAKNFLELFLFRYNSQFFAVIAAVISIMLFFLLVVTQMVGAKYIIDIAVSNNNVCFILYVMLICTWFALIGITPVDFVNRLSGCIMLILTFFLVYIAINAVGGLEEAKNKIAAINLQYFSPLGPSKYEMSYTYIFSYWIYIGFGILGMPTISFRAVNYNNNHKVALLGGTIIVFIMVFNMALIGILSIPLFQEASHGDEALPLIIKNYTSLYMGNILFFIILLTLIGAMKLQLLSVNIAAKLIVSRVYPFKGKSVIIFNKISILVLLIIAAYFAFNYKLNLFYLMILTLGGFASTFTWAIVFTPFKYKFVNKGAAISSVIFGAFLYSLIYNVETYWRSLIYPATIPVILGFFVYIIAGYLYYFFTRVFFRII